MYKFTIISEKHVRINARLMIISQSLSGSIIITDITIRNELQTILNGIAS